MSVGAPWLQDTLPATAKEGPTIYKSPPAALVSTGPLEQQVHDTLKDLPALSGSGHRRLLSETSKNSAFFLR